MKKLLSLVLSLALLASSCLVLASCGDDAKPAAFGFDATGIPAIGASGVVSTVAADVDVTAKTPIENFKIGLIMVGDDSEGYTKAHMDGIKAAAAALSIPDQNLIWKLSVEETEACYTAAADLVAAGCQLIISNSYGHQDFMKQAAIDNPTVTFVAATGDTAATAGLSNFCNAFTGVYESRYVSGVVAGLKLQELIDADKIFANNKDENGNIKIGYVGAFNYAEVVSGYTAFYLGLKSIVPNVVMDVQYTNSWFNFAEEGKTADALMARGCVIIGQHADSEGAPTAVKTAMDKLPAEQRNVYSVGYNVSMLTACPDYALTSASNNWEVYYEYAFKTALYGMQIATNWCGGYNQNAVAITALGTACAEGTAAKVDETVAAIKDGTIKVFDVSKFTVDGKNVAYAFASDTDGDWTNDANNVVADGFYHESYVQSAPSFSIRIDGITELN